MLNRKTIIALTLLAALPSALRADPPLSAIDWLSDTVATPVVLQPHISIDPAGGDISNNASVEDVSVTTLNETNSVAVGLLPVSVTGLPRAFWGTTPSDELARLVRAQPAQSLPALQDLLQMLLLAELDAPIDADSTGVLFLARIDKLLDIGAVDQAQALLERAGTHTPDLFRRWFDVALLTGTEDKACEILRKNADIAPTFPARIFCLARGGDWNAAALSLETAKVLGFVTEEEDALLARFLDPELFEGEAPLPPPKRLTPLIFRMREAIGEAIPTNNLPRAFANADLRSTAGWKSQIEAAERLAETGAVSENLLLGLYTERLPAASGGVWERVEAMQAFDTAYRAQDPTAVTKSLLPVWHEIEKARLEVPFAALYAEGLAKLPLTGDAALLAFQIGLLSEDYESIAGRYNTASEQAAFLLGLAKGELHRVNAPNADARMIKSAFTANGSPAHFAHLLDNGQLGEAILKAIALFSQGSTGDVDDVRKALELFRATGLEDVARRAALQFLLLDRRG